MPTRAFPAPAGVTPPAGSTPLPVLTPTAAHYVPVSDGTLAGSGVALQSAFRGPKGDTGATGPQGPAGTSGSAAPPATLADAPTVALDGGGAVGPNAFRLTLAGNRTLGAPTNLVAGRAYTLFVRQDATGGRTLAFAAGWLFPNGVPPTLTAAPGALDVLSFMSDGASLVAALNKAFA